MDCPCSSNHPYWNSRFFIAAFPRSERSQVRRGPALNRSEKRFLMEMFLLLSMTGTAAISGACAHDLTNIEWRTPTLVIISCYVIIKLMVYATNMDDPQMLRVFYILLASFTFGYGVAAGFQLSENVVSMAIAPYIVSCYGFFFTARYLSNLTWVTHVGMGVATLLALLTMHFCGPLTFLAVISKCRFYLVLVFIYQYMHFSLKDFIYDYRRGRLDAIVAVANFFA